MRQIQKHQLSLEGFTIISLQREDKVLHVAEQRGELFLWIIRDEEQPMVHRTFRVFPTGATNMVGEHVGTVLADGGRLVWHVFEVSA